MTYLDTYKACVEIFEVRKLKVSSDYLLSPIRFDILEAEATVYFANSNDDSIKKYLPGAYVSDIDDAKIRLIEEGQRQKIRQGVFFCIRPVIVPAPIGYILLNSPISGNGLGEWSLDFWLNKKYRGKGIMTDCLNQVLDFMQTMEVPGVVANTFSDNEASAKILSKVGFFYRQSNAVSGQDLYAQRLN